MKKLSYLSLFFVFLANMSFGQISITNSGSNILIENYGIKATYQKSTVSTFVNSQYFEVKSNDRTVLIVKDPALMTTPVSATLAQLQASVVTLLQISSGGSVTYGTTSGTATEGNDSRVNNGQTAFSWGNHASAGYATASNAIAFTNKTGNISQWTNNSGYLTSVPAQSFASLTGKPTTVSGYGITDAVDFSSNQASIGGNKGFTGTTSLGVTNINGATGIVGLLTVTGNIVPEAGGTRSIGSTSLSYSSIYTSNLLASGTATFGSFNAGFPVFLRQGSTSQITAGLTATNGNFVIQPASNNLGTDTGHKLQVRGTANITADISMPTSDTGIILTSTNGTKYRLTVSNAGAAVFTLVP